MAEYKTKLEEFTLEELKAIVSESPEGWEDYRLEDDCDFPMYFKDERLVRFIVDDHDCGHWDGDFIPDYRVVGGVYSKEDILCRINLLKFVETDTPSTLRKLTDNNIKLDVSEFVNSVYMEGGKVIIDIDKEDIEGVIKLLKEMRDG